MFLRKRKNNTPTVSPQQQHNIVLPKPTATLHTTDPSEKRQIENYINTADGIHFNPLTLQYKRLMLFLKENGIPVFDYNEVAAYLESKLNSHQHWQWTPLRKQDMEPWDGNLSKWYGGHLTDNINGLPLYFKCFGTFDEDPPRYHGMTFPYQHYDNLVPEDVLLTASRIAAEFPTARFYVSKITAEHQDPFMCVSFETRANRADHITRIIFATWNEPGW